MHKYQPRVHIIKKKDHTASLLNLKSEEFRTFIFPETVFTAVTAYQNQLVSVPFTIFFAKKDEVLGDAFICLEKRAIPVLKTEVYFEESYGESAPGPPSMLSDCSSVF